MRVIFMGTPDFSVGTLEAIIEAGHEVALVVTQPDKPKGRGKTMQYTPVKECALSHGIEVFQPVKIRETANIEYLRKFNADIIIVVALDRFCQRVFLICLDTAVSMCMLHFCQSTEVRLLSSGL